MVKEEQEAQGIRRRDLVVQEVQEVLVVPALPEHLVEVAVAEVALPSLVPFGICRNPMEQLLSHQSLTPKFDCSLW